jgi:hypothetical protein
MNSFRFGTAIDCMDGRTQRVVIDHMKQNYNIDGVDMEVPIILRAEIQVSSLFLHYYGLLEAESTNRKSL